MQLSNEDKKQLLKVARWSIEYFPESRSDKLFDETFDMSPSLQIATGCFVSVYVKAALRGCIGTFSERDPLHHNVRQMAVSAAFHDNRFDPVRTDELNELMIELSVLTPRKRIEGPQEIEIGKHGIYMTAGMHRGTLLPQVAERNEWTAIELLEHCARYKAGLSADGWKHAELYTYEAIVFSEVTPS
jgi:AmmeMemoRadiSam system protein A